MAVWGFLKRATATNSAGAATGDRSASSLATGTALTIGAGAGAAGAAGAPQPSSATGRVPRSTLYETHRDANFERSFDIGATLHAPERETKRRKRASGSAEARHLPRQTRVPRRTRANAQFVSSNSA